MKGGAKTGFRHVEPEQYEARLLEFKKVDKNVKMTEVKGDNQISILSQKCWNSLTICMRKSGII